MRQPVLEADRTQARVAAGGQRLVVEHIAEVARVYIRHHLAGVVGGAEQTPHQLIQRQGFGAGDFHGGVERRRQGHIGERRSDVIGSHGLDQRR
ncbi:hypothetical protein D3C80_1723850 [compost metagenome]